MKVNTILHGDCLEVLKTIPDDCIDCCCTSPPYFRLRDYNVSGQAGIEDSPESYVKNIVNIFNEVKRVLKPTGTLWINIGDSYCGGGLHLANHMNQGIKRPQESLLKQFQGDGIIKKKDLIGIPWMVAFALRNSGWYLRSDIIWNKINSMPESVTDRVVKSHEYIFMLTKENKYFFDYQEIQEKGSYDGRKEIGERFKFKLMDGEFVDVRNKRSVWNVPTKGLTVSHFASYPQELIIDCIKAGCPKNGIVLDPFFGTGTTGIVAAKTGRTYIGIELNQFYIDIAKGRIERELGIFNPQELEI